MPIGNGLPPGPPAAYILLTHVPHPIVAAKIGILQRGTIHSTAPPAEHVPVASEVWLPRFNGSAAQSPPLNQQIPAG
ncbi:hypothetical protein CIW54_02025 [Paraburkholderia sp. T12-10]|nr:hypothetical protein CIW54_02025 [Paraburkholderia sp. T12-10]